MAHWCDYKPSLNHVPAAGHSQGDKTPKLLPCAPALPGVFAMWAAPQAKLPGSGAAWQDAKKVVDTWVSLGTRFVPARRRHTNKTIPVGPRFAFEGRSPRRYRGQPQAEVRAPAVCRGGCPPARFRHPTSRQVHSAGKARRDCVPYRRCYTGPRWYNRGGIGPPDSAGRPRGPCTTCLELPVFQRLYDGLNQ